MKSERKETGSFYTCSPIAEYIADWAITDRHAKVLEPSFGEGEFLCAAVRRFAALGEEHPSLYVVELQAAPFEKFVSRYPQWRCPATVSKLRRVSGV